jgi:hypothetical protein
MQQQQTPGAKEKMAAAAAAKSYAALFPGNFKQTSIPFSLSTGG